MAAKVRFLVVLPGFTWGCLHTLTINRPDGAECWLVHALLVEQVFLNFKTACGPVPAGLGAIVLRALAQAAHEALRSARQAPGAPTGT